MNKIISKKEALLEGLKYYFTGKFCKRGHLEKRYIANGICLKCASIASYKSTKNRRKNDLEFKNKDNEYRRQWAAKKMQNPEYKKIFNVRAEELRKKNPTKHREKVARHKLAKIQRVPAWLSKEDNKSIKSIYAMRDWLNLTMFGIKYEVDHIIPIRGKFVSGLHVPNNLQIIKSIDNAKKGNIYEMA